MEIEITGRKLYYLRKLSQYLNYELSSSILYFLSNAVSITLILAIVAATIFTPFMLYFLFRAKKIGWLITFFIIVIIPFIICIIIGLKVNFLAAFALIPLGFFYFYCFILKISTNEEIRELSAHEVLLLQKAEEENKLKLWQQQFDKKLE